MMSFSSVAHRWTAPEAVSNKRRLAYEALLLASAPVLTWVALRFVLINQDGQIDPWYYTGYGRIFRVMHAQFGWPYYAARFPVIDRKSVV